MNTSTVDVMIYIQNPSKPVIETGIPAKIEQLAGVIKANVSPIVKQLLMVKYDPQSISAHHVLSTIKHHGYNGILVGM